MMEVIETQNITQLLSLRKHNPGRIKISREKFSRILNSHSCKCSNGLCLKNHRKNYKNILLLIYYYLINNHNKKKKHIRKIDFTKSARRVDLTLEQRANATTKPKETAIPMNKPKRKPICVHTSRRLEPGKRDTMIFLDEIHSSEQRSALLRD